MREQIKELLKPLILDEGIAFVAIYRIDGTPIFVDIKRRGVMDILHWLEEQVKILLYYLENGQLSEAEIKISSYRLFLQPLSKSLVLTVLADDTISIYKLRIDISTIRNEFLRHV